MNEFIEVARRLNLEITDTPTITLFGLKWGEGKVGQILGISRKKQIIGLNWADKNPKEALRIITGK